MFLGHFGAGYGAKSIAPAVSLGTFFLAVQFVDLLWPTLLLLDIEQVMIEPGATAVTPLDFVSYPVSHSLFMVCIWGALFSFVYWLVKKDTRAAVILGLCVVSHWFLDLIVHRPDLPIYPGNSPLVGLGLWNSLSGTLLIELLVFSAGIFFYLKTTRAKNRTGVYAFWGLAGFLVLIYFANLFGPPPPDVASIAWAGHLQWLLVVWAYWIDRNRETVLIDVSEASAKSSPDSMETDSVF